MHRHTQFLDIVGDQGHGAGHMDIRPQFRPGGDVAPGHPAVEDIPDDGHLQALELFPVFQDGEHVQKSLGGMRMGPVPGVDHHRCGNVRRVFGRPFHRVPHDDGITGHGLHGQDGVLQAFPLLHAGGTGAQVDHVGAQVLPGQFEGTPGPGAVFIEQVHDGFAPERRELLDVPFHDLFHLRRRSHDQIVLFHGQGGKIQDIPSGQADCRLCHVVASYSYRWNQGNGPCRTQVQQK